MKRVCLLSVWAAAMFVGRQLAGALHELGHALVGMALGGRVESIQLWPVLGQPITDITGLSNASRAIVDLSGVIVMAIISVACLLLIPWRRLSALTASSIAAFLLFFVAGSGAISFFAFSTGLNDASNFILHSGANRHLAFLLSCGAFLALVWLFVSRTDMVARVLEAFAGPEQPAKNHPGPTAQALLASFFLVVAFALYGLPEPAKRMQVGLAVLLDGVGIKNMDSRAEILAGEAQVHYRGEWFRAGFGALKPGATVELFYESFTNSAGDHLPPEVYSPAQVRISAPGYSSHNYRAEVNGQNPRVSAQWSNRLSALPLGGDSGRGF